MNGKALLQQFGFTVDDEPVSIYPYSPVFRVGEIIVKRTQRQAAPVVAFTRMLHAHDISIVTPAALAVDNPQPFEQATYIAYPFIHGDKYRGTDEEIYAVGQLLGRIHALSPTTNTFALPAYDVYDFTEQEVTASIETMKQYAAKVGLTLSPQLCDVLLASVARQPTLAAAQLPHVATPYDVKANNFIFTPAPYIIDPDNASWVPRVFDVALTLLLFHNEHAEAPAHVFTPAQWSRFLAGYKQSVTLTEAERHWWESALQHIFLDEAMWLLTEYEDDWQRPDQQQLFCSLLELLLQPQHYSL